MNKNIGYQGLNEFHTLAFVALNKLFKIYLFILIYWINSLNKRYSEVNITSLINCSPNSRYYTKRDTLSVIYTVYLHIYMHVSMYIIV